jgi:hypothetical protein
MALLIEEEFPNKLCVLFSHNRSKITKQAKKESLK